MIVPFKSRKLRASIIKMNKKVKDNPSLYKTYVVYGVTKEEGISITGNVTSEDLSEYIIVGENTFAFNPYRVNIGSIGLSGKSFKGLVSPAYVVFKTKDDLLPEFLFHFLKSDIGNKLINWYGNRGGVRNALRFDDLGEIDIPDLTVSEQKQALKKIEAALNNFKLIDKQLVLQQNYLQQLRQSILQEAVQGKLVAQDPADEPAEQLLQRIKAQKQQLIKEGKLKKEKELSPITEDEIPFELPKVWVWCRLGDIALKITDGFHNTPTRVKEGYPYVLATHIKADGIDFENCSFVSEKDHKELWNKAYPKNGEILLVNIGAGCGTPSKIEVDFEFSFKNSAIIKQPKQVNSDYLFIYLLSIREKIYNEVIQGGAQPYLSLKMINHLLFPLPPLSEQERIIFKAEQLIQMVNQLEQQVQQSKEQTAQLLKAVLKEAFSPPLAATAKLYEENEVVRMVAEE